MSITHTAEQNPVAALPLDTIIETREQILAKLAHFAPVLAELRNDLQAMEAELMRRCELDGGTAILHPTLEIRVERKQVLNKREDVFREVLALPLPDAEKDAIVHEETVVVLKTDATKLKSAAKKYGGKVADIADRALDYQLGPPKLIVRDREPVNVTPAEEEARPALRVVR